LRIQEATRSPHPPYQRLLNIAASADAEEDIRQGLEDIAHGRTRPAREFLRLDMLLEAN